MGDPAEEWLASRWGDALKRLNGFEGGGGLAGWTFTRKYDPRAIGRLLLSSGVGGVPEEVAVTLGRMLAPSAHYRGLRLKVIAPPAKRTFAKYMDNLFLMRNVRGEYLRLMAEGGKHEAIVSDLKLKYEKKRTWITDAIALTDEKFIDAVGSGTYRKRK